MQTGLFMVIVASALGPPWMLPPSGTTPTTTGEPVEQSPATPPPAPSLRPSIEQITRGTSYRVLQGERTKVLFRSEAPMGTFEGQSGSVQGFVIVERNCLHSDWTPIEDDTGTPRGVLLEGAFAVPMTSIDTGIVQRNEHMASSEWLDAAANPAVTFELAAFEHPRLIRREAGVTTFEGALVGDLVIHGIRRPLRIDGATAALMPEGEASQRVAPGDLLMIRCAYRITLDDFGITHPLIGRSVGKSIDIEQSILMTSAPPDAAPAPEPEDAEAPPMQGERITDVTVPPTES